MGAGKVAEEPFGASLSEPHPGKFNSRLFSYSLDQLCTNYSPPEIDPKNVEGFHHSPILSLLPIFSVTLLIQGAVNKSSVCVELLQGAG